MQKIIQHFLLSIALLLLVSACTVSPYGVPVIEKSQSPQAPSVGLKRGYHIVHRGDTLYSIAWNYGFDYKDLAKANHIYSPYTIKPGQKIYLKKPPISQASSRPVKKQAPAKQSAASVNQSKPVYKPKSSSGQTLVSKPTTPSKVEKSNPVKSMTSWKPSSSKWLWPSNGKIIKKFSSTDGLSKGIDLSGTLGDSILSAKAGKVVYAGSGLTGYGKLVIIKHDDRYLSAYAHASRILVAEGQSIAAGQKIGEVGSTGSRHVKLHFEIRDNGKPVDPLKLLPKR